MTTNIEFLIDENIREDKTEINYDNLLETIFDLSIHINTRMTALELYYLENKEETIEIVRRLSGMYHLSGISILEQYLLKISQNDNISILLRLESIKSLIMYKELENDVDDGEDETEKEDLELENELIRNRNIKRVENSSKALFNSLKDVSNTSLPTPCRIEAIYMLMIFKGYKKESKIYFNNLINDQNIECEFRYKTILSLETKCSDYIKDQLKDAFGDKNCVKSLYTHCNELISKEFPNFSPDTENQAFFELLIERTNFEFLRQLFDTYCPDVENYFEYFLLKSQFSFLFCSNNMTYYRILSGQYILQKFSNILKDVKKFCVENTLLSFAEDEELDYNLRADAADVLMQLGSSFSKESGRKVIMQLGSLEGTEITVFDNAQNVHTHEVESSVNEALEFFSAIPLYKINKQDIDFNYVKEQIEKILKDKRSDLKLLCELNDSLSCFYNGMDSEYCSDVCADESKRENKIKVALNRIYMDRALYSKYNSTLSNILLKVWSYLTKHEHEDEMKKRLLEELEEMSGTCSSGFASRLINVTSGFGDFSIRISWEDQIIANFAGRLNAVARKITDKEGMFYNEKLNDVMKLWFNSDDQKELKETLVKALQKSNSITDAPNLSEIIDYYLIDDSEEKIMVSVEIFAENVLNEMILVSSNTGNRLNFSLFFRSHVASIREEMYKEFTEYLDDTSFDVYMRKAIMRYEAQF